MRNQGKVLVAMLVLGTALVPTVSEVLAQAIMAPPLPTRFSLGIGRSEGFGARALGMGGAFLGVADDATAVIWNPAGLGQMSDAQIQVGGRYFSAATERAFTFQAQAQNRGVNFGGPRAFSEPRQSDDPSTKVAAEFAAFAYPFYVGAARMVLALSASEGKTDFGANQVLIQDYRMTGIDAASEPFEFVGQGIATFGQAGSQRSLAGSVAYNLDDRYLFGLTVARLEGTLDLTSSRGLQALEYRVRGIKVFGGPNEYFRNDTTWRTSQDGLYAIVGLMVRPSDQWTLAGVYRTKSGIDLKYRVHDQLEASWAFTPTGSNAATYVLDGLHGTSEATLPALYGAGVAFRPTPSWTIAAEYSASDWSNATFEADVNGTTQTFLYPSFRPVGRPAWIAEVNLSAQDRFSFEQFRSGVFRVGTEYVIARGQGRYVPIRLGVVREEAIYGLPGEAQPVIWGYSVGFGYLDKRIFVDFALLYDEMTQKVSKSDPFLAEEPYFQFEYTGDPATFFPQYVTLGQGEYSQRLIRAILSAGFRF